MRTHVAVLFVIAFSLAAHTPRDASAVEKRRASGTFDVVLKPLPVDAALQDGTSDRMSLEKRFHGDLAGTSNGQMLAARTQVEGSGGYVAIERISGTLHGRTGTFLLQHSGWMSKAGGMHMIITVVPDSGTGQLTGLSGSMTITIVDGRHFYGFEYVLATTQ